MVWSYLTSDWKSVIPITYLSMCILLVWYGPFSASEATTASKQPWKSHLTPDLKSVTQITYVTMVTFMLSASGPPEQALQTYYKLCWRL